VGDEDPGPAPDDTLEIVVRAKRRGSLGVGSPVTYRDVHVGEVRSYRLAGDARCVEIVIGIAGRYRPLVRDNSVFWNVSGIGVEWGVFSGLTVQSDSIESILTGGIAFATPEKRTGAEVEPGHVFDLADKPDEAWLNWAPAIEIGPAAR
jgi:paraquat-inducible protein B